MGGGSSEELDAAAKAAGDTESPWPDSLSALPTHPPRDRRAEAPAELRDHRRCAWRKKQLLPKELTM